MENKKKIVHLIKTLGVGGCEMALLRMLPRLNDKFENIIVTLEKEGILSSKFRENDVQVISLDQKKYLNPFFYTEAVRMLKLLNPDLLVTHLFHADFIGRLFIQWFIKCRTISSLVTTYNFEQYWVPRLFERITKNFCQGYIANAVSVKKAYVDNFGISEEKITILPCAIDVNKFNSIENSLSLRKSLRITKDDFVIICVANLHINKGHKYLLETQELLYKTNPDIKLLLVGDGEERINLERQVALYSSIKNIHFLGKRSDVPQLLAISDVFVLPTFFEGMSNAIMEAMASGLPVITTNIPENRELISDKNNGILCPLAETQCLMSSLTTLKENHLMRKKLGEAAKQKILNDYNLTKIGSLWEEFFMLNSSAKFKNNFQ